MSKRKPKNDANNNSNDSNNNNNVNSSSGAKEVDKMGSVKQEFATLVNRVEKRIKELDEKEDHWAKLEELMEEHASKVPEKVTLDIGGQKFATSKTTLLSHKGSFFDAMLSSGKWKPDSKGRYFIDRNPELFPVILDYMRTGKVTLKRYAYDVTEDLRTELEFYLIDIPDTIITRYKVMTSALETKLKEWTGKSTLTLLYCGSKDGFGASNFHSKCDNKGAIVVVIKSSQGHVFGGYSTIAWDSSNQYKRANGSFLFTFSNPYSIQPTTFPLATHNHDVYDGYSSPNHDIFCNSGYGPTFGGGNDLLVNQQTCSFNFPNSYSDTLGRGAAIFAGSNSCNISEIEVFQIK